MCIETAHIVRTNDAAVEARAQRRADSRAGDNMCTYVTLNCKNKRGFHTTWVQEQVFP